MSWAGDGPVPQPKRPSAAGWARAVVRGVPLALVTFGGLVLLLVLRLIERPLYGLRRPVTPHVTRFVCRTAFRILGIAYRIEGRPMREGGAMVANHSSWLDIFALNAPACIYFVSKAEVADWPGIGWLARATGTVFIRRDRREARAHVGTLAARLAAGHRLVFFPEGTSTDGQRVLPFKPTLFAAFLDPALPPGLLIQPVSVVYRAPEGSNQRLYGWWGDMEFGPHLLTTLAQSPQGSVTVIYHTPLRTSDHPDRKVLARMLEQRVRHGLEAAGTAQPMRDA